MGKSILLSKELCSETIDVGVKKGVKTSFYQTLILSILAGAFISLGAFTSTVGSYGIESYGLSKLVAGLLFPIGLVLILICGGELFTGNILLIQAYMERKLSLVRFIRNLIIVYVGNFIGAFLIALLLFLSGILLNDDALLGAYAIKVAYYKGSLTFINLLASGILCNLLVCLAVWGSYAAKDMAGKILIIWVTIMAFITSGFEHCIANMYYFSIGLLAKLDSRILGASTLTSEKINEVNIGSALGNIIPVTIGNIIGGLVFVGLAYWVVYIHIPRINENKQNSRISRKKDIAEEKRA